MTRFFLALASLIAFTLSTAHAATYSWTDERGTVHFTENVESVPEKFRDAALREEETQAVTEDSAASPPPAADTSKALTAVSSGKNGQPLSGELFAGKTFQQWEKELREREAAMTSVRTRIDEIDALLKNPPTVSKALRQERHAQAAKFKEMQNEYNQLLESIRKAGLEVTIEK